MFALFAGYQLLSITSPGTLSTNACALGTTLGYGNPALFGQCTLAPDTTYLSVYVDAYCGVQINPIKDTACGEPGAAYWSNMTLTGSYVTPTLIANSLNTAATNLTSSYLLTIIPIGGSLLTLSYWPASTDISKASSVSASSQVGSYNATIKLLLDDKTLHVYVLMLVICNFGLQVCSGTVTVIGGQLGGEASLSLTCPAGSYGSPGAGNSCFPWCVILTPTEQVVQVACSS